MFLKDKSGLVAPVISLRISFNTPAVKELASKAFRHSTPFPAQNIIGSSRVKLAVLLNSIF